MHKPKLAAAAGSHPTALLLSEPWLFVTLSNTDEVAVIEAWTGKVKRYISVKLREQRQNGAYPNALAQTPPGYLVSNDWHKGLMFVANASSDAVAVLEIKADGAMFECSDECHYHYVDHSHTPKLRSAKLLGFIPTEWYPTALAAAGGELFIASGKGQSTGPNNQALKPGADPRQSHPFIASLLHGSVARVKLDDINTKEKLKPLTAEALRSNLMRGNLEKFTFAAGGKSHQARHLRDQGKPHLRPAFRRPEGGDGDPSLTMYGEEITPNQHKLARQFGLIDNFYD